MGANSTGMAGAEGGTDPERLPDQGHLL